MIDEICPMPTPNRSPDRSPTGPLPGWAWRAAVPGAALCAFGGMAVLWVGGLYRIYFGLLNSLGVAPFRFPFLDIEAVLAAGQCTRYGIDVHVRNPCDVLGRIVGQSPLWLTITPHWLGVADTTWVGVLIAVAFLASLVLVMRPRSLTDVTLFALAVFSPATMFALERANADLILFLLILYASAIDSEMPVRRASAYILYLLAGLLKYYPLALLILLVRNSRRAVLLYSGAIFSALLAFAIYYHSSVSASLPNIAAASCHGIRYGPNDIGPLYFGFNFGAKNLPFGMACWFGDNPSIASVVVAVLLLVLATATALGIWGNLRIIEGVEVDWTGNEMRRLALASVLITACFAAGPNNNYREIYFLLVIPGLVRLRLATTDPRLCRRCSCLITVILLLMWEQFIRPRLEDIDGPATWFAPWFVYELLWWWLIAALGAIAASYLRRQPLSVESMAGLHRLWLRLTAH
jgi:hypothetical protein